MRSVASSMSFALVVCAALALAAPRVAATEHAAPAPGSGISEECALALKTQAFIVDQLMQLGGIVSDDSYENKDLQAAIGSLFKEKTLEAIYSSKDLYTPFQVAPYWMWANQRVQAAMSASVYVPSANLGEIQWAVSNITAEAAKSPADHHSINTQESNDIWSNAWYALADTVMDSVGGKGCPETTDDLSCRSAVLRNFNYVYTGQYSNPTSPNAIRRLQEAAALFDETMASWEDGSSGHYYLKVFNTTFNNGTNTAELRTIYAGPRSPKEKVPLLIFWVPNNWLAEIAYMRYGIGALRRGYAVLMFEGPGGGLTPRVPPYMPTYSNSTAVLSVVLDAALAQDDIAEAVDADKAVLIGVETGSFMAGQACIDLGDRLTSCVLSPPVPSQEAERREQTVTMYYGPWSTLSATTPGLFPDEEIVDALADPGNLVYEPLLHACPEDSGAPQLFNAILGSSGLYPDSMHAVLAPWGGHGSPSSQDLVDSAWWAFKRGEEEELPWDPSDLALPVLMTHGTDDVEYRATSTPEVFKQMPEYIQAVSEVTVFEPDSGGALISQRGATPVFEETLYPFLIKQLGVQSSRR